MKTIENNLTQGSVFKKLWAFTLPLIGANLLQILYGMVDLYIVGRFAETSDVSAVSVSTTVLSAFLMFLIGLSVGATVVVGQKYGAGEKSALSSVAATGFSLAWIVGAALMVIAAAMTRPILGWIHTPAEAMRGATQYMLICSVGYLFQSVYNMLAGILRGMGESKSPLLYVAVATVVNIVSDTVLVAGFGLGAAGTAIATVFAQFLCMLFAILHVKKRGFPFDFRLKSYRLVKKDAAALIRTGLPIALQQALVLFSFVIVAGIINRHGLFASAAAGILDKVFMFATIPTNAFHSSISAMVAQNIGAGAEQRAVQCLRYGSLFSFLFALAFFITGLFFPAQTIRIFTSDSGVVAAGVEYYAGYKYDYLICSLAFCINGFINGTGRTRLTLIANLISTYAVRIPACILVANVWKLGMRGLGFALPVATAVQVIIGFAFYISGRWKKSLGAPAPEAAER